jgi:cell shape-determining protein MreD
MHGECMKWRPVLLVAAGLLVQLGLLVPWRPLGVVPSLALAIAVWMGLMSGASEAVGLAAVAGLAMDFASGSYFGLWTLLLPAVALGASAVRQMGLEPGKLWPALGLVLIGTIAADVAVWLGLVGLVDSWPIGLMVGKMVLELLFNILLAFALWPVARWMAAGERE